MNQVISNSLIEVLRSAYMLDWNGLHGASHWSRVKLNGLLLSKQTGADPVVIELFSFFHDSCRRNDGNDPNHGNRAAEFVDTLQGTVIDLSEHQLRQLQVACRGHTHESISDDVTVATCWDADRLDLWRVGIEPDPQRLLTAAAKSPTVIGAAMARSEKWLKQRS